MLRPIRVSYSQEPFYRKYSKIPTLIWLCDDPLKQLEEKSLLHPMKIRVKYWLF